MFNVIKGLFFAALDIFYPKYCISCNKEDSFLCENCYKNIRRNSNPVLSFKEGPIQRLFIPSQFHGNNILRKAVHLMKYTFYKQLSRDLANLFIELFQNHPIPANTHLVPIPLHKKRLKQRGFNQSLLLAEQISAKFGFPMVDLLCRNKETKSQATLTRKERIENIKNSFEINTENKIPHQTPLLIIDDICTTLSTLKEAAWALQKNGYTNILAAALARAELIKKYENRN